MTIRLTLPRNIHGRAWLRTHMGHADISRREVIAEVLERESPLCRDWFDIPMVQTAPCQYQVTIPLRETGHFEAKPYFLEEGNPDPLWPDGPNLTVNVEPAHTCCGNIIYNAFVRQFGPNKAGKGRPDPDTAMCISRLDQAGYTVIPRSGTFRELIRELDFIIGGLGCRYLQLLPIHPTPTTYGRMGRFGSPYAALSFTEVDPALAEFDPRATPLDQFIELVDAVHAREGRIIMDIAINHTGWAASLHETHPQWLARDAEGRIEMPGAWGVTWADLTKLDYTHTGLWAYIAAVFLTWCRRGVDGFRCDAGYMIPLAAWKFITAQVRDQFPETIFFLEGLGGKISVTRDLLNTANLNWAYSELFQNYDRGQIEYYLHGALQIAETDGLMIHFAETHDNNRLAARSKVYARMRTALCALLSQNGGFAFANGVEWYAAEKINVHEARSLNWGAADHQIDHIRRLNALLMGHPAFHDQTDLKMVQTGEGNAIALARHHQLTGKRLLVLVNLDDEKPTTVSWENFGMKGPSYVDLISGKTIHTSVRNGFESLDLAPGETLCLTGDAADLKLISGKAGTSGRITDQRLRAKVLDVYTYYIGVTDIGGFDVDGAARFLADDPLAWCRSLNPFTRETRVISWQWPEDLRREVMVPPGHFLMVCSPHPFQGRIVQDDYTWRSEESFIRKDGSHFALFLPIPAPKEHAGFNLKLSIYEPGGCVHGDASLLYLAHPDSVRIRRRFKRKDLLEKSLLVLGTNGRGGMMRAHGSWGRLESRYDALLAANLHPDFPEDRWIMFTRCRAWVRYQGFSYEIGMNCLDALTLGHSPRGLWEYHIPTGQGEDIALSIGLEMIPGENAVRLTFSRGLSRSRPGRLDDARPIRLILRPDIEDRNFHHTTKAYAGPEHQWPGAVSLSENGFVFAPAHNRRLRLIISRGEFISEPEWHYMIHRPLEAERGLDPHSDLFSPGYFSAFLKGGESAMLLAQVMGTETHFPFPVDGKNQGGAAQKENEAEFWDMTEGLTKALDDFVVYREQLNTVIAGYPWFLDWGRDTLIGVRGMIACGKISESRAILKQFARFEKQGTLPNMIRGDDAGNRDTSDAPLWFFVACADLTDAEGDESFLDEPCEGRTLRQILHDMTRSLTAGTPNGIVMDPESGLLFSPSHFTWMDTNYPAGTPREGYPIEIQALWHFALQFMSRISRGVDQKKFADRARQTVSSIRELFFLKDKGYLSDCRHGAAARSARQAEPDDALRPNQILALTLGAVEDGEIRRKVLDACAGLLVPGAIRSLADRPVSRPLEIVHHGKILNNPLRPYQGRYQGDEDTRRKPAYHNGTAWTWPFPSFCEAWAACYGEGGRETARAWLGSAARLINSGCAGHVPEILDGDAPHTWRGCDAQAWGASELLRVWLKLKRESKAMSRQDAGSTVEPAGETKAEKLEV
jgi:predicted glycogen debranching enzyme